MTVHGREADGVRFVVPVLPLVDPAEGMPLATARLHGSPLFAHAVRTLAEAGGDGVLVTVPRGGHAAVSDQLGREPSAQVIEGGDTLGEALLTVLGLMGPGSTVPGSTVPGPTVPGPTVPGPTVSGLPARGDGGLVGAATRLLVVHDPRCPLVPASFVRQAVALADGHPGEVVVGTRPVTDTVKSVVDGTVQATVDRDRLVVLTSPLVLPVSVLRRLAAEPALRDCGDVEDLVSLARGSEVAVRWLPAPGLAWRVDDVSSVSVLESVTDAGRGPR